MGAGYSYLERIVTSPQPSPSFNGLRVLSFESRRAQEIASLITTYGGVPLVAPALREVALESNAPALAFADRLLRQEFDITVFLTGVGTRELLRAAESVHPREALIQALSRTRVVARGPKPLAVLRELGVPVWATAAEPNTWRELLAALDQKTGEQSLQGARIAVQEYGVVNEELVEGLERRGASVTRVPVYRWALPDDVGPLKAAIAAAAHGDIDIVVFTTGVQLVHVSQLAREMGVDEALRLELGRALVASIGPTTSEEIRRQGLPVDFEAAHPKFGSLVRELAEGACDLLRAKRARAGSHDPSAS
jgi:uroporphyrinogen-III synthase